MIIRFPQPTASTPTTFRSFSPHIAQLSTTTYHDACATPPFVEGHLLHFNPRSPCSSNCFRLPTSSTTSSRSCHSPRCSPTTQEDSMGRIKRSGSNLSEPIRPSRGGSGKCEEVRRLAQNEGNSAEGPRLGRSTCQLVNQDMAADNWIDHL